MPKHSLHVERALNPTQRFRSANPHRRLSLTTVVIGGAKAEFTSIIIDDAWGGQQLTPHTAAQLLASRVLVSR